jgi:hypothetical protein
MNHFTSTVSFSILCIVASATLWTSSAVAEETVSEKIEVTAKDAKRGMKKGMHRTTEAVCMQSDAQCRANKRKHKMNEAKVD